MCVFLLNSFSLSVYIYINMHILICVHECTHTHTPIWRLNGGFVETMRARVLVAHSVLKTMSVFTRVDVIDVWTRGNEPYWPEGGSIKWSWVYHLGDIFRLFICHWGTDPLLGDPLWWHTETNICTRNVKHRGMFHSVWDNQSRRLHPNDYKHVISHKTKVTKSTNFIGFQTNTAGDHNQMTVNT